MALEEADRQNSVMEKQAAEFDEAQRFLKSALVNGKVVSALRSIEGGVIGPALDASYWNTETFRQRFVFGQMHPLKPFSSAFSGDGFLLIFVNLIGLQEAIKSIVPLVKPNSTAGLEDLRERAAEIYRDMKATNQQLTRKTHEAACAKVGISSKISREVYSDLYEGR